MLHRVDFTSYKILFFSLENPNVTMKVGIIIAINCLISKQCLVFSISSETEIGPSK